jgi:hypothetical protein
MNKKDKSDRPAWIVAGIVIALAIVEIVWYVVNYF